VEILIPITILLALFFAWRYIEARRRKSAKKRRELDEPDIPEDPWKGFDRKKSREEAQRSLEDDTGLGDVDISD
jgi:hypothetical protein